MTSTDTDILTTVSVQGVAFAEFDSIGFSATTQGNGATAAEAKEALQVTVSKVKKVIEELKRLGLKIVDGSLAINYGVAPNLIFDNKNRRKTDGYIATCDISFRTLNIKMASQIMDALTSIEEIQVESPDFKLDDVEELHREAFKDAVAKAQARFEDECDAFNLDSDDYAMKTYQTRYDESLSAGPRQHRAVMAASVGSGGDDSGIEIVAGKAVVRVNISVTYAKVRAAAVVAKAPQSGGKGVKGKRSGTSMLNP
jgi:uncharacterized protein